MNLFQTILILAFLGLTSCQSTRARQTIELNQPIASKSTIADNICSQSGNKHLCQKTMTTALESCKRFKAIPNKHARCILGSIQAQLRNSNVKYLLLGEQKS